MMESRTREELKVVRQRDPWLWRVIQLSDRTGVPEGEVVRCLKKLDQSVDAKFGNLAMLEAIADFVSDMIDPSVDSEEKRINEPH